MTPETPCVRQDWRAVRIRFVAGVNPPPDPVRVLSDDAEVSFLPMEAIGEDGSLRLDVTRAVGDVKAGYSYFEDGDVVFAKVTPCFENGKGALMRGLASGVGFGTTELTVLRPRASIDACFLNYFLTSPIFRGPGAGAMTGAGGLKRVPDEFTRNTLIPVPPPATQTAISHFLDRETARIDALIEKKTRFNDLLREKRQTVVTRAVTKGLNPTVPFRPSNVDWLEDVPSHWQVVQVRHVARLGSGHTPSRERPEWWENCTIPWFTLADVWQVRRERRKVILDTEERISALGVANSSAVIHPAGSVMLSRTASVGFPAIMGCDMATSQDFAVWRCGPRILNEFLYVVLLGMRREFNRVMMGSTHKTIYMPDIEAFRIALPPIDEQVAIIAHVEAVTRRVVSLLALNERSIRLLKERRAALITAAVTGQIDVRPEVPVEEEEPA